ncbi:hypothetical protein D9M70_602030 [compost metagenome]
MIIRGKPQQYFLIAIRCNNMLRNIRRIIIQRFIRHKTLSDRAQHQSKKQKNQRVHSHPDYNFGSQYSSFLKHDPQDNEDDKWK